MSYARPSDRARHLGKEDSRVGIGSFASLKACARSNSVARVTQRLASSSSTSFRWESVALSANSLHRKPFWRHSCGSMSIVRLPRASLFPRRSLWLSDTWAGKQVRNFHISITNMHAKRLQRPSFGAGANGDGLFVAQAPERDRAATSLCVLRPEADTRADRVR